MDDQLIKFIKDQLAVGQSISRIYTALQTRGYSQQQIDAAFKIAIKTTSEPQAINQPINTGQHKHFDITKAFVVIGSILIAIAVIIVIYSQWYSASPFIKILFLLIPMLSLYGIAWYLNNKEQYKEVSNITLGLGSFILPFLIGTTILQLNIIEEINPLVIFLSAITSLPIYIILEYIFKKHFISVYTVIVIYVAYFALAEKFNLSSVTLLWLTFVLSLGITSIGFCLIKLKKENSSIYTVMGTIASMAFLLCSVLWTLNDQEALSSELNSIIISGFGLFYIFIASGYYFLYKKSDHHSLYSVKRFIEETAPILILIPYIILGFEKVGYATLALFISAVIIFMSTKISIKSLIYLGSLGIITTVLTISSNVFSNSMGWPIIVFVTGFAAIGIGLLIRKLFKNRKESGVLSVFYGLGIDPNVPTKHFSVGKIILIIVLIFFFLSALYYSFAFFGSNNTYEDYNNIKNAEVEPYNEIGKNQTIPEPKNLPSQTADQQVTPMKASGEITTIAYDPSNTYNIKNQPAVYTSYNRIVVNNNNPDDMRDIIIDEKTVFMQNDKVLNKSEVAKNLNQYKNAAVEYDFDGRYSTATKITFF